MNVNKLLEKSDLSPSVLQDRGEYIRTVRKGVSGKIVQEVVRASGERDLFVRLLNTSSANLNRFYHQKLLTKVQSEGILDTLKVFDEAIAVFGDASLAKEWLHTSIPALEGEIPIDLCDTFEGRKLVRESLQAIEYGEFT